MSGLFLMAKETEVIIMVETIERNIDTIGNGIVINKFNGALCGHVTGKSGKHLLDLIYSL